MTIDEAIRILSFYTGGNYDTNREEQIDAMKLGIEALKLYKEIHGIAAVPLSYKLPGETKD